LNLLELGNFLSILYASFIPYYIAYRVLPEKKSFAYLSIILGAMLSVHSLHHIGAFIGVRFVEDVFGLTSAVLAVIVGLTYSYLKYRAR